VSAVALRRGVAGALVASVLFALLPLSTATASIPGDSNGGLRIMPLGDSITEGYDIPGGYRTKLYQQLAAAGKTVDLVGTLTYGTNQLPDKDHEGHSGWRIDQLDVQIGSWLAATNPRTILLQIGTNDVNQNYDLANAPARLAGLIDHILLYAPTVELFVASITPQTQGREPQTQAYNAAIPGIVSARGPNVHFFDMHAVLTGADLSDGTHPTQAGFDKMGVAWAQVLLATPPSLQPLPNLALGKAVTASTTVNGNLPGSLVDGTTATRWESATADPQWITIDLGEPTTIDSAVIRWEAASAKTFQLQVSTDNATWANAYATSSGPGGIQSISFTPVTARYVRLYLTQRNTQWAYSVYDLELYHHDLAAARPVTVSSTTNGNLGSYLTDGTTSTRWESQGSDPQGILIDLGQPTSVGRVVMKWEAASAKSFEVLLSTNGTTWSSAYSTTSGPGGVQAVTFTPASARYVWVYMTQRNTQWAYSMYDMEVYAQ